MDWLPDLWRGIVDFFTDIYADMMWVLRGQPSVLLCGQFTNHFKALTHTLIMTIIKNYNALETMKATVFSVFILLTAQATVKGQ